MTDSRTNLAPALHADGVSWQVRGRRIVHGVSLGVSEGEVVGLLGPNGSGKSSLIRLLAGLRRPAAGTVHLAGTDLRQLSRRERARRVAVVEQEAHSTLDLTAREVIQLGRIPHRAPWRAESGADADAVALAAAATEVEHLLDRRHLTLSGGERQRIQIARALAQDPDILLLDEPTNHLDIRHQLALMRLVSHTGRTTVVALHDLNLAAAHCDRLVLLDQGRVHSVGTPDEVLTEQTIATVYGVAARVEEVGMEMGQQVRISYRGEIDPPTPRPTGHAT